MKVFGSAGYHVPAVDLETDAEKAKKPNAPAAATQRIANGPGGARRYINADGSLGAVAP